MKLDLGWMGKLVRLMAKLENRLVKYMETQLIQ